MTNSVEHGGVRIGSYEVGYELLTVGKPRQTIVLLNGSLFNLTQWATLIKVGFLRYAGDGVQILRYDYGGTGRSPREAIKWNVFELADELEALLEALRLPQVHLYGVSKGTIVGQVYASRYTARVASLAGYGWFYFDYSKMDAVVRYFKQRLGAFSDVGSHPAKPLTLAEFNDIWTRVYERVLTQSREGIPSFLVYILQRLMKRKAFALLEPTPARVMYDWFAYAVEMMPEAGRMFAGQYLTLESLPMLIQHARRDGTLPFEMAQELKDRLPNAQLIEYGRGYNHVSIMINPAQAVKVVKDYFKFLNSVS